ncbi:FACT complex subunit SSRP1-like [Bolinopsis microptera]|uniref:FACT complex subunit SSRP1-like n=1 Tax=Bolinopsis microptera TaxID=2820187 RepID=UPI00307A6CBC
MTDAEGLDYKDVAAIVRGALCFGRLRFHPKALMFKAQSSGKIDQFGSADICETHWMRASRGYQLVVITNSNAVFKFVGLEEKNKEQIKRFIREHYDATFTEKEPFVKGWNWGSVDFAGPLMVFHNDEKPLFEVPLPDVSTATVNKNEVTVEFHQDDDNDMSLVEMRFYVPNITNDSDDIPADNFHRNVMKYADVIKATGDVIVKFEQVLLQTPRGRYDVDMYPSFLRLHGKSYDYKIPYSTMIRMFLLPHNDQRSVYFVISTDPPIRQGQTRYPHLVIQFIKDDWSDLTLELDEETIATKYEGKLQKEMAGPTYETFSKVMKFVVGQKIFVPGNFVSSAGSQAIACSHKANSGFLYPLEKGFMFVVKPPVHIRFDETSSVNFSRVASGVGQSRSFDLEIETNTGANYIFASIEKKEYSKLFDFLKGKKIRIQNTKAGGDETFADDFGDGSASDNELPDHYLEKMKKEGQARDSDDDSDESEDEDFVAGETPDTSPSSSSETEEGEGDEKKKKKKKVAKETVIGKQKGSPKAKRERKEPTGKKTKAQRKAERDPNKPKKPPTAYFLWLGVNRGSIKDKNPGITVTEIAKKAGEMWRGLTADDKLEYEGKANQMKEEYNVSIIEYNKNLALNPRPVSSSPIVTKKKSSKPSSKPSSTAYKSKEMINTDDDLSTDSEEEKPLKPKPSPPKKEEPASSSKQDDSDSDKSDVSPKKAAPEESKKRKREEPATSSKQDESESEDSDVAPPEESSSEEEKAPPPKRSMRSRGAPTSAPANLPDDTFGDEEYTDGEAPPSPKSSESD